MHDIKRRSAPLFLFLLLSTQSLCALDFGFESALGLGGQGSNPAYLELNAGLNHASGPFSFLWRLEGDTSDLYTEAFHGDYFGNFALDIAEAGVRFASNGFSANLGRLKTYDVVQSPYSLFINGSGLALTGMQYGFEDERFLFRQIWVHLGSNSEYGWFDRGAVQKSYAIKLGAFRFGFQDAAVTAHSVLDPYDFLLPAPSFLVQYVALTPGRPWSREHNEYTNKNAIMGFFADYQGLNWYAYGQLLVDDFNANAIFKPEDRQFPSKMAASLGGSYTRASVGTWGFYAAAALKYTFQPMQETDGTLYQYPYTLYPANAFYNNDSWQGIPVESHMLGYRNGENDLSVSLSWQYERPLSFGSISELRTHNQLEFSVTGSQSPGNPWHEYEHWTEFPDYQLGRPNTAFLDDQRLRYRLRLEGQVELPWRELLLGADYTLGYEWNRMELDESHVDPLVPPNPKNDEPIWRPGTQHGPLLWLRLRLLYTLRL